MYSLPEFPRKSELQLFTVVTGLIAQTLLTSLPLLSYVPASLAVLTGMSSQQTTRNGILSSESALVKGTQNKVEI